MGVEQTHPRGIGGGIVSETYVTYRVWDGCKAPINLEYSGRLIGEIARELTVDRDALLALADEMEEFGNLPVKHPGVRVLHSEDFSRELGYARRIREACGVGER